MSRRLAGSPAAIVAVVLLTLAAAGCTSSTRRTAALPEIDLRLGLLFTTGGQGGDLAGAVLGSVKLATEAAAERKVKIVVTEVDYAGDRAKVAGAVAGLASKVDAILVGTDDGAIAGSLGAASEIPVLHPFITADAAVPPAGRVFRFAPSNRLQAERLVEFLTEHRRYTRIAVIADDTGFGREGLAGLRAAFAAAGGVTPVAERVFTPGGDIHTHVSAVAQAGAQAAIVWTESPGEAARIVVDAHRSNYAYQIALSGNLATETFAKNASAQVTPVAFRDGLLSVGVWAGPWFELERIVSFYDAFQRENSALAPVRAAAVYDAVLALAGAARAGGAADSGSLVEGLEALRDFEAAGVPVTFGPGKHEGVDLDDVAVYGFTKTQTAPGGRFAPDVDTGGGFFTVVTESLDLPDRYAYLKNVS